MKTFITTFLTLSCLILWPGSASATIWPCQMPNCPAGCGEAIVGEDGEVSFTRTYQHRKSSSHSKVTRIAHLGNGDATIITKADFEEHMALDKKRIFNFIPRGNTIPMDVGPFDQFGAEAQEWNMPDFTQYNFIDNLKLEHVSPESTGFAHVFPEATHTFFIEGSNSYEFAELTEDDLFVLGKIDVDSTGDGYLLDAFLTAAPIPLELGLEFEGTVIIEYTDDPDIDSLIYIQEYIVSGFGTLNTYDDGPVDALKMNYTQSSKEYKDGTVIRSIPVTEVVWYSVEGHFLRGSLPEGAPTTDQVTFEHMEYQRLDNNVNITNMNAKSATLNFFPNPISAGDVLTITNLQGTHLGLISLQDMQGRLVQQMDLSDLGAVQNFKVQLPNDLMPGLYTYHVSTHQGVPVGQGKLQVQ